MNQAHTTPSMPQRPEAAPELLGFEPGAPGHIRPETLEIDTEVARQSRCRSCRKRGLTFAAYRKGRLYAPVASCPRCGTQELL